MKIVLDSQKIKVKSYLLPTWNTMFMTYIFTARLKTASR